MAALMVAGGLLIAASGCSPSITSGGNEVADPEQPLQTALAKLKDDNNAGIQNNSITVSDDTDCFYLKPNADADAVSGSVACGPVRRLGQPTAKVWDTYALTFGPATDGKVTATVGAVTATSVDLDPSLLVSPDGTKPGTAADLPAPQAPQTSVADRAVALPLGAIPDLTFAGPTRDAVLKTPTATFTVTGVAAPKTVPSALVAGTDDPAGVAAYYRPAQGQRIYAATVKVSDPAEHAAVAPTAAPGAKPQSLSTELTLGVADGKELPIADATDPKTDPAKAAAKLNVACQQESDQTYPCRPDGTEFMIIMTVPADGGLTLGATTAGERQAVDLQSGRLSSTVSQVEYDHDKLTTSVDEKLKVPSYTARVTVTKPVSPTADKSPKADKASEQEPGKASATPSAEPSSKASTKKVSVARKASWRMTVGSASLTAFDPTRGWAPSGKAWLSVQTTGYTKTDEADAFADRRASSVAVTAAGSTYRPDAVTDADFDGSDPIGTDDVTWVFEVPQDLSSAEFTFAPTGVVTAGDTRASFTADEPDSVKITFG
ncbi:hypothetical protein [Microlunatus soli]|uniref:Uncharacterized protein n=1 Tax=Microlunatus soli TaxID=630515 RepID=A0A1H1WL65_9ACTN|nr:hypothetical protein [Microlunatus soli]SDS97774.1 hypothetical protein SAMN04489812_3702 [Microlunatus soli]